MFKKRENVVEIEEGNLLSPKFDNDGLIPVITMCSKTKEIFKLSKQSGLTNKEISKFLDISVKTVEFHITKSYKFLKTQI